jgi:hypothetical protein
MDKMFENILNIENIYNSKMCIRRAFGFLGFWVFGHLGIWAFGHLGIWAFRGHLKNGFIVTPARKDKKIKNIQNSNFILNYLLKTASLNFPYFVVRKFISYYSLPNYVSSFKTNSSFVGVGFQSHINNL